MAFRTDRARLGEHASIGAGLAVEDRFAWQCHTRVEKYDKDAFAAGGAPSDVLDIAGNMLVYSGADLMWLALRDGLSASTGLALTRFNNANAAILFGDSTSAAAITQTDLQASSGLTHRISKAMDATFPTHTTGSAASTSSKMLFKATLASSEGNFSNGVREWAIGNRVLVTGAKPYTGRILNRKVQNLGTKTSAGVWVTTITLSLA